jgi:hypothetical protein
MMFLSHIVVTVIAVMNTKWIVSQAQSTTDDDVEQCSNQTNFLNIDTELYSLYPRNVSCQSSTDTYCAIDFNSVAGVEGYKRRCYELQGRIGLFNWTNFGPHIDADCSPYTADLFSFTNDPICLGTTCARDFAMQQLPSYRLDELGIVWCGYIYEVFGFNSTTTAMTTGDADRSWAHITISIVAVAVAVSLLYCIHRFLGAANVFLWELANEWQHPKRVYVHFVAIHK